MLAHLGGQVPPREQRQGRARYCVRALHAAVRAQYINPSSPVISVYNKTLEYVKTFAKFSTTDSASAVREYVVFLCRARRTHLGRADDT